MIFMSVLLTIQTLQTFMALIERIERTWARMIVSEKSRMECWL